MQQAFEAQQADPVADEVPMDERLSDLAELYEDFALRGLQVINGGGFVALLGFLGASWNTAAAVHSDVVIIMAVFALGMAMATGATLLRIYSAGYWTVRVDMRGRMMELCFRGRRWLAWGSFTMFCGSLGAMLFQFWLTAPV